MMSNIKLAEHLRKEFVHNMKEDEIFNNGDVLVVSVFNQHKNNSSPKYNYKLGNKFISITFNGTYVLTYMIDKEDYNKFFNRLNFIVAKNMLYQGMKKNIKRGIVEGMVEDEENYY